MIRIISIKQFSFLCFVQAICCLTLHSSSALPLGFGVSSIQLDAPPVGLAFDTGGTLYAMEGAPFGTNVAKIRVIHPDGSFGTDILLAGDDEDNFFIGGMTYDPITDGLLITDNTSDGRIYSLSKAGTKQLVASGIPAIAGVAVRSTGEIFVSTALGDNIGQVVQVDRTTGNASAVVTGIDFGAGLAFDASGDLYVQDADATTFAGRIHRLPITVSGGSLAFGSLVPLISNMQSGAGIVFDGEGDLFTTGSGGLYKVAGEPPAESLFYHDGDPFQFATAIAFNPGSDPFEPFAGSNGGRLVFMGNFGFSNQDTFVTLITPAEPLDADFNDDSYVDGTDLQVWQVNFGACCSADNVHGDADGDQDVDGRDLLIWQRHYFPSTDATGWAVPEPGTLILVAVMLISLGTRRNRTA